MKYTYAYKTSDGVRHEASLDAESREEVFAVLRERGIKAIKVVAADGSKANGEVRGVRKRVVAAIAIFATIVVGIVAFFLGESNNRTIEQSRHSLSAPRHQIYGDPAIMEPFERGDFGEVLANKADQMLAWFAQPGRLMCPPDVQPQLMADEFAATYCNMSPGWREVSDTSRQFSPDDSREVRELKQIVNGMREELREYLANGNGTPRSYWRRLNERLDEERKIYERTRKELEADPSPALRAERNAALRNLGLRTIPAPKRQRPSP